MKSKLEPPSLTYFIELQRGGATGGKWYDAGTYEVGRQMTQTEAQYYLLAGIARKAMPPLDAK